ncbi:Bacillibactin transport regulator [Sedimentisphaera cyanobacteriorum]|uniref:Bacillibactin transport regulator n=1 Tax=Sedimentisphaera cyanobacteriorum TaxID=1940790 RepID=A0A1Q2HP27_9BACT|nr:AraC family transcriptional regulator [Sedimentisphaera cyanobacteriorum]AQQ09218.1 Bacillibactin transport regulator [Sedimentisphaera cyanobacteriorum]
MKQKEQIEKKTHLALEGSVNDEKSKYFFFDTKPDTKEKLAVVFGGYEECAPDFEIQRRTYPYYVLEIPTKGECFFEIDTQDYKLKKGTIGAFAPGTPHHYRCNKDDPMEHIFLAFTGTYASKLFETAGLGNGKVVQVTNFSRIDFLTEVILEKGLEEMELSSRLCSLYLEAVILEQTLSLSPSENNHTLSLEKYRKCKKYIDGKFSEIISPMDVAEACSVNIRYMSRLFKRYSNITPQEYIMRLKLNKAASILLTTNLTIREVGYEVGFEDPYHFSRNFKKFHGSSPLHFKNTHIGG